MAKCGIHIVQERHRPSEHFLHVIHISLIDFDSLELFLKQLESKESKEDSLDKSGDTHNEGKEVALLEKQRNLVFILHKRLKLKKKKKRFNS